MHSLLRGVVAGGAGGAVMSISTNAEMRLRGRPPSVVPARTVERLLGLDLDERQERRLVSAGHVATSAALGVLRALLDRAGLSDRAAGTAFLAVSILPDFVLIPALGGAPPPWRWSRTERAVSLLHHGVYALAAGAAYRAAGGHSSRGA